MQKNQRWNGNYGCDAPVDHGPEPYVANVNEAAIGNCSFRSAFWTGEHLQLTLMSIPVGGEIGAEVHLDTDQYIRVEAGQGIVLMGKTRESLTSRQGMSPNAAVFVPAGTWHNIVNAGAYPLKLSSVYAPPHHPRGTVHNTKWDAEMSGH